MAIRQFKEFIPNVAGTAYVDEAAAVIGRVQLAGDVSIWPMAVLRGDIHDIRVGARSNIQDGAVVHVTHDSKYNPGGRPTVIGEEVTVGHQAMLHGCEVGSRCLVGMSAIVLDGAVLEDEVMLGAGSLVPPGKRLESGYLYVGSPAKKVRLLTEDERNFLRYSAAHYVKLKDAYILTALQGVNLDI